MQVVGNLRRCVVSVLVLGGAVAAAQDYESMSLDELYQAAQTESPIVFYTSQVGVQEQNIVQGFTEEYPGVDVEVVYAGGGALYERLLAEAAAGRGQADVHLQSDLALMERLREEGLLAQYNAPEADSYPDGAKGDGYWTAVANVVNVFIYNNGLVSEEEAPRSWADLFDPQWGDGRLAVLHVGGGGVPWALYFWLRNEFGIEYWESLAAQNPVLYDGGGAVVNAVVSGTSQVGVVPSTVAYGSIREGAPISQVAPAEGMPGVPYLIGVLDDADSPHAARLFVNWYLSEAGQERLAEFRGSISPRPGVPIPEGAIDPSDSAVFVPSLEESDAVRDAWSDEWFEIFNYRP